MAMQQRDAYEPEEYWERLVGGSFDLRAVGYPELSLAFNEYMYRAMADTVDRGLARVGVDAERLRASRVLDVGSGVGFWIEYWRAKGVRDLRGVDLTHASVERLAARYPELSFERRDIADPVPPALEGAFDLISVMSVLNHIPVQPRWEAALANLGRMLAAGGVLIVMDPVARHTLRKVGASPAANGRVRTVDEHAGALAAQGVRLERVLPTLSILANPVDTCTLLEYRLLSRVWGLVAAVGRREGAMRAAGPAIYALDRALWRAGYMPSSKVLLFRKPAP